MNQLRQSLTETNMPMDQAKKKGSVDVNDSLSDLPQNILELITKKLTVCEFIRFGAVHAQWRSVAKEMLPDPKCKIPWLILGARDQSFDFLNLLDRRIYKIKIPGYALLGGFVGSSDGWLISECLYNPFNGDLISLPRFEGIMTGAILLKAPSNSSSRDGTSPEAKDFVVVARGALIRDSSKHLAFCRPKDREWTFPKIQHLYTFDTIVFERCVYTLTDRGSLWIYDLETCSGRKMDMQLDCDYEDPNDLYLVELCGDLLMVARIPKYYHVEGEWRLLRRTTGFQVFKLDIRGGPKWVKVESLGDHALFVGKLCSKSLCAMDFLHGIRRNCIYFNSDRCLYSCDVTYHDTGIFSLEDGSIESYLPSNFQGETPLFPLWVMSEFQFDKFAP